MPLRKTGSGQVLPDEEAKVASKDDEWSKDDEKALRQENQDVDSPSSDG